MHAITIKQPWAFAICTLGKRVENRKSKPPKKLIGQRIAIHAGLSVDVDGYGLLTPIYDVPDADDLPRGAVVATARLKGWYSETEHHAVAATAVEAALALYPWFTGPIGHVLDDVRVLATPIKCRGQLGYWRVPADVADAIALQEAA